MDLYLVANIGLILIVLVALGIVTRVLDWWSLRHY